MPSRPLPPPPAPPRPTSAAGPGGRTHSDSRAGARRSGGPSVARLPYQPPYNFPALLHFLQPRAVAGLETITLESYQRHQPGLQIKVENGSQALHADIVTTNTKATVSKLRRYFDLDADSQAIDQHLAQSPLLKPILQRHQGIRIPGCWDGFELAIRAILGQQVTVKGATTLMNRLVTHWGPPDPAKLADAPVESIGLPSKRAETIRALARAILQGRLELNPSRPVERTIADIQTIPGLGPWTAHYIAMRAHHAEDAFPASDLGLLKAAGVTKPKQLEQLAEPWRPYRAYAAFYLWRSLA